MSCRLGCLRHFARRVAEQFGEIACLAADISWEDQAFHRPPAVGVFGNAGCPLVEFGQPMGQFDHCQNRWGVGCFLLGLHGGCIQPVDSAAEAVAVLPPQTGAQAGIQ